MNNNFKPTSVRKLIEASTAQLKDSNIVSARLDALLLVGHVLAVDKHWLLTHPDYVLDQSQRNAVQLLLARRVQHEPIAYIIGSKEFYGRSFIIQPGVLVPRPETEDLVELALALSTEKKVVLDLGTGSGIIGITLALERPGWHITLVDNDIQAITVARLNQKHYKLSKTVTIRHRDMRDTTLNEYDLIMANLPYVPEALTDKPDLANEPAGALFSGQDGLDHYRTFFLTLAATSKKPPTIITESLLNQHAGMNQLAASAGYKHAKTNGLAQQFERAS